MIVRVRRSGLVEAEHPIAAAAVDRDGAVIDSFGSDLGRSFFARSAIKPFQTFISQRAGADLGTEQMAIASASHAGQPVHVAYVREMLDQVGLTPSDLRCPSGRPAAPAADQRLAVSGRTEPSTVFHMCSGKHAAMLRACKAQGWSLEYAAEGHPLHNEVVEIVTEASGRSVTPVGVDGCGVPTLRTDVVALARSFSRLAADDRFAPVLDAVRRYTPLTSDGWRRESEIARWVPSFVKAGAAGCVAAVWTEGGVGFAAKAWTGDETAASVALLTAIDRVGILSDHQQAALEALSAPPVMGKGAAVGRYEVGPA